MHTRMGHVATQSFVWADKKEKTVVV